MENYKDKISLITKVEPELIIDNIDIITSGYHSVAIVINNKYIFRFPLKSEFFNEYIQENKIINLVRPFIYCPLPKLKIYNLEGQVFTGHLLIKGEQYSKVGHLLNKKQRDDFSDELARFIFELHSVKDKDNIIKTLQFNLEDYGISENIDALYEYLKDKVKIDKFKNVLEDFEKETQKLREEDVVICHNDLNENNILINENNFKIAGIIDFGNSIKRDFSSEFASLLKYDYKIILDVAKKYEKLSDRKVNLTYALLVQKIRCYGGMVECIDSGNIERMKCYNQWLENLEKCNFNKIL